MSFADISYEIDDYAVQVFGRDWGGDEHKWARARLEFFDESGSSIGGVVFLQEGNDADSTARVSDFDSTTLYGDDQIWLSVRVDQFDRILDLLRYEDHVYVHWKWRSNAEAEEEASRRGYGWISTRGEETQKEEREAGLFPYITKM